MPIQLTIAGCCGRMGCSIASLALQDSLYAVAAAFEAPGHEAIGRDLGQVLGQPSAIGVSVLRDARAAMSLGDVTIDFTIPEATIAHAQLAKQLNKPMVIGTTGFSEEQIASLRSLAAHIPIVLSPNMSVGVNLLFELAHLAAQRLGSSFDVEVIEAHHRHKKDSPSGTAKRLAQVLAAARKQPEGSILVHAIRAGDIVGDHTVILAGPSERIELTHSAHSREVFARGALRAAAFVVKQPPGLYAMADVLKA